MPVAATVSGLPGHNRQQNCPTAVNRHESGTLLTNYTKRYIGGVLRTHGERRPCPGEHG
jgi:hypothetical protein